MRTLECLWFIYLGYFFVHTLTSVLPPLFNNSPHLLKYAQPNLETSTREIYPPSVWRILSHLTGVPRQSR